MEKTHKQLQKEKRVRQGLLAVLTSASVLVGTTFDSPEDILNKYDKPIKPLVEDADKQESVDKKTDNHSKDYFKNIIYKIPLNIRLYIFVPLWFLGTGIIYAFEILLKIIEPLTHILIGSVIHFLLLLGIVGICVKLLFPNLPLSKIFNKKTLLLIILGSIILSLCDLIMPIFLDKYRMYRTISKLIIGISLLAIILKPFIKKKIENLYSYEIINDDMNFKVDV